MADRDVDRDCSKGYFVGVLRRLANSIENGEPFRIQVVNKRFTVPADATYSVEHEVEDGIEELELQLRWPQQEG
jgi:amphi-Trp domain-containing protein